MTVTMSELTADTTEDPSMLQVVIMINISAW